MPLKPTPEYIYRFLTSLQLLISLSESIIFYSIYYISLSILVPFVELTLLVIDEVIS
jgi:hypothetical protein